MSGKGNVSSPSCLCRRKFAILCIVGTLTVLFFVIREKYFYRADVLIAMSAPVNTNDESRRVEVQIESKVSSETGGGFLGFFGFSSKGNKKKEEEKIKTNPWDEWMLRHKEMTSIGDIYDKCGKISLFLKEKTSKDVSKTSLGKKKQPLTITLWKIFIAFALEYLDFTV